ncbi:MAG: hypothetical protein Q7V53_07340, partial [Caldisericota bacterium]|nr:hypothetical protein [Caldisericota bacterium]
MQRERTKKSHVDSRIGSRTRFWILLLCTNVIVGIMLVVVLSVQRRDTGDDWNRMLSAVADEKASALDGDIQQQLGNVVVLAHTRSASQLGLGQTPVVIPGEPTLQDRLLNIFESARSNYRYSQVMLTTSQGIPIVALPDARHVVPHLEGLVVTALATGKPQFIDVFVDSDGHVLVGYVGPVFDPSGVPAGAVVALADPKTTLFGTLTIAAPLMNTGETVLLRRSTADQDAGTGIEIIYTPDLALPVGDTGVQVLNTQQFFSSAIQGTLSPGSYSDPQGQSMMGVARLVPSAGWVIVAGVSMKEALGDFVKTGVLESVLS